MSALSLADYYKDPSKAARRWENYSSKNRLKLRAYGREHYNNNIKPILEQKAEIRKAEWEAKKPERLKRLRLARQIAASRYRAKKRGNGGFHSIAEWEWVKFVQNFTCLLCGKQEPNIKLTQDHIVPITKGGTDNIGNIQGLCGSCNSIKNSKFADLRAKKFKSQKK
jgi:5-methylcytosine-specific restriction endonuclease McrA